MTNLYPRYKDSGVEWLGAIPQLWHIVRIKSVASCNDDVLSEDTEDDYEIEYIEISGVDAARGIVERSTLRFSDAPSRARRCVQDGDVLVSTVRTYLRAIAPVDQPPHNLIVSTGFAVIRPRSVHSRFLSYVFRSEFLIGEIISRSVGVSYPAINASDIMALHFAAPALLEEQSAIANFLDRETGKIDALVAEQEKLIELLKEKRQAVISRAVTKGLDLTVPMKDSGIEWLGKIPAHWTMKRLKHISPQLTVGIVVNPSNYIADEGPPFLYGGDISEGRIDFENARRIDPIKSEQNKKTQLRTGDIITVRVGAPGVSAVVPPECDGGNCASVMLVRSGDFISDWLCYAMNSRMVRYQVEIVQYGAAQEQFNISHAVDFWVATPPRAEQQQIKDFLEQVSSRIDALIWEAERAIHLLKEHRSALVSAAVTGKIDVRGLVGTEAPTRALEPA